RRRPGWPDRRRRRAARHAAATGPGGQNRCGTDRRTGVRAPRGASVLTVVGGLVGGHHVGGHPAAARHLVAVLAGPLPDRGRLLLVTALALLLDAAAAARRLADPARVRGPLLEHLPQRRGVG